MPRRRADRPARADEAAPSRSGTELKKTVCLRLAACADARKAPAMQAYMKSAMPYRGVQTPALRRLCRELYAATRLPGAAAWRATVLALWRDAEYREERYAAVELAGHRFYREYRTMDALPMYEEMIVTGAWWDYVDAIATQQLVEVLRADPAPFKRAMRAWARSDDIWKRRSAILCQLRMKRFGKIPGDPRLLAALEKARTAKAAEAAVLGGSS
jgi:3-methyladenine DNA glycosylase AlkD